MIEYQRKDVIILDILSETLRKYISESGYTIDEIAKKIGVTYSYISKIQNNKNATPPADETLVKLCEVLRIPKDIENELLILSNLNRTPEIIRAELEKAHMKIKELIDNEEVTSNVDLSKTFPLVKVPIYGAVSAGVGELNFGEITGYTYSSVEEFKAGVFFMVVKGNSMESRIPEGCLVKVLPHTQIRNGDIGVFLINHDEGVVKQFYEEEGFIRLVSFNRDYRDIIIMPTREDFRIIGKVNSIEIKL